MRNFSLVLSITFILSILVSVPTEASYGRPKWKWGAELIDRAYSNWAPLEVFKNGEFIEIEGSIADDGKVYSPKIVHTNGNAQLESDCLHALVSAQCHSPRENQDYGVLKKVRITFNSETPLKFESPRKKDNKGTAFYLIPIEVLKRYPGLFSESELISPSNLVYATDEDCYIYRQWTKFFLEKPNASKSEIFQFSKQWAN